MVCTFNAPIVEMDFESDKSRCSNHRDVFNSAVATASKVQVGRVVHGVLCIAQASYIYIRDYVRQKVRPAILVRESST
jgi:hypothetical protein